MTTLSLGWTIVVPESSRIPLSHSPSLRLMPSLPNHRLIVLSVANTDGKREPRGITKPRPISPALQDLLGVPVIPRTQALKRIWAYIKENNLQDPDNKKIIICDEKLKNVFGGKERVGFLEIAGLISPHFLK